MVGKWMDESLIAISYVPISKNITESKYMDI